mgnify:FL=1
MTLFTCELCDFSTDRPNHYARHNNTNKHKRMIGIINDDVENKKKVKIECDECGKFYADRSGLFNHRKSKKCKGIKKEEEPEKTTIINETILKQIIEKTIEKEKLSN